MRERPVVSGPPMRRRAQILAADTNSDLGPKLCRILPWGLADGRYNRLCPAAAAEDGPEHGRVAGVRVWAAAAETVCVNKGAKENEQSSGQRYALKNILYLFVRTKQKTLLICKKILQEYNRFTLSDFAVFFTLSKDTRSHPLFNLKFSSS